MNFFENKKILIISPHQDDEINIAGGILTEITKYNKDVYVLYTTNGDYVFSAKTRVRECLHSCKKLGVDEKTAYEDSCLIEHDLSAESFEAIKKATKKLL